MKEFLLNIVAFLLAIPALIIYGVIMLVAIALYICKELKELLVVALLTLLTINYFNPSQGLMVAIAIIAIILLFVADDLVEAVKKHAV